MFNKIFIIGKIRVPQLEPIPLQFKVWMVKFLQEHPRGIHHLKNRRRIFPRRHFVNKKKEKNILADLTKFLNSLFI
jgi:hypothetical protein